MNEQILNQLRHIQEITNEKPILKSILTDVLDKLIVNNDFELIQETVDVFFGDTLELLDCMQTAATEKDFYSILLQEGFEKDFIEWFWQLSLVYFNRLSNLYKKKTKGMDWKRISPKVVFVGNEPKLSIDIERYDNQIFSIQADRYSYLVLVNRILRVLVKYFNQLPLDEYDISEINEIREFLLSMEQQESVNNNSESINSDE